MEEKKENLAFKGSHFIHPIEDNKETRVIELQDGISSVGVLIRFGEKKFFERNAHFTQKDGKIELVGSIVQRSYAKTKGFPISEQEHAELEIEKGGLFLRTQNLKDWLLDLRIMTRPWS